MLIITVFWLDSSRGQLGSQTVGPLLGFLGLFGPVTLLLGPFRACKNHPACGIAPAQPDSGDVLERPVPESQGKLHLGQAVVGTEQIFTGHLLI